MKVRKASDRTYLLHLGGKIEVVPKVSLRGELNANYIVTAVFDPEGATAIAAAVRKATNPAATDQPHPTAHTPGR